MNNSLTSPEQLLNPYNRIPVHYCKECLSLKIMRVAGMEDACYCDDCGSTNIEKTSIDEWEDLYKERHGFSQLNNSYYDREEER